MYYALCIILCHMILLCYIASHCIILYYHIILYIIMYVCIYVCMHACMHACMYVCMYVCICIHIYRQYSFDQAGWLHTSITTDYPAAKKSSKSSVLCGFAKGISAGFLANLKPREQHPGHPGGHGKSHRLFIQLNGSKWAMFHSYHTYVPFTGW